MELFLFILLTKTLSMTVYYKATKCIFRGKMLRWWENEDDVQYLGRDREEDVKELREQLYLKESLSTEGPLREWRFQVSAETVPGETICVTGGSFQLGHWNSDRVFLLKKEE